MTRKYIVIGFYIILILCSLLGVFSSAEALISGFLVTLFLGEFYDKLKHKLIHWLLKISVVGLGFGMYLEETLKAGKEGFGLTVFTIFATLGLGFLLTKILKLDKKIGYMVSSGTSICGGSAIAAVSSVIKAAPKSISVALGVIFLLNALALFIFPPIGHFFGLSQTQFGLWSAVAIHDTSSVVGASMDYGPEALKIATTVKLARALWIIPISILSMVFFHSKKGKINIPWFIFLFILAILINSYFHLPNILTSSITSISQKMLVVTLFLIGSTLSIKDIKQTGAKPFILGVILWIFISISSLYIIMNIL